MAGIAKDYNDVANRIVEFREKHPTGSLVQVDLQFLTFGGKDWVVYTAAAYRSPEDVNPGIGTAWEPVPGPTSFTRDSELQNAETSAWGRAMVAALAVDTKTGIASNEEIKARTPDPINFEQFLILASKAKNEETLQKIWNDARVANATPELLEQIKAKRDGLGK